MKLFLLQKQVRSRAGSSRHGFTLVELTVSIALAALLLSAMVGVLSGLMKQVAVIDRYDTEAWPPRFIELLRRDLVSADEIWAVRGAVHIRTHPPRYHGSGVGMRTVIYMCVTEKPGKSILVREDAGRQAVIAVGPDRISLERLDKLGTPQPLPSIPGPMPTQARLWIWSLGEDDPLFVRDLVLR